MKILHPQPLILPKISHQKREIANSILHTINNLKSDWPVTPRDVFYALKGKIEIPAFKGGKYPKHTLGIPLENHTTDFNNKMQENDTDNLIGKLLNALVDAGELSPESLTENESTFQSNLGWDDVEEYTDDIKRNYRRDKQQSQSFTFIVLVESATGMIQKLCAKYDLPYYASKGSPKRGAMRKIAEHAAGYNRPIRFLAFTDANFMGYRIPQLAVSMLDKITPLEVTGVKALMTVEQGRELVPEHTLQTRGRGAEKLAYQLQHGNLDAFEMEALQAAGLLKKLVEQAIESELDMVAFEDEFETQQQERETL